MTGERPAAAARPRARGEPDRLAARPSIPKPLSLVRATDPTGRLRLSDRKLVNVLLGFAWTSLMESDGPYHVLAVRVREALGQHTQHKNTELRGSLRRLGEIPVVLRLADRDVRVPWLESWTLPKGATALEWRFHAAVLAAARDPRPWSPVRLDVCARLREKSALILYELLAAYPRRDKPWIRLTIDELRELLSLPPGAYTDWHALRKRTVEPAIAAINAHADYRVAMTVERARGRRGVQAVRFHCTQAEG